MATTKYVAALAVLGVSAAWAHAPVVELEDTTESEPIKVTWPLDTSVAIYGHLEHPRDIDVVSFVLSKKETRNARALYLHSLVPACKTYEDLLPVIAVTGPEQKALPAAPEKPAVPFQLKPEAGISLITNEKQGITWYEPYSRKNYYWQKSTTLELTRPGQYRIYVWSPQGVVGDYVLAIGSSERWGAREIARAVRHMPRLLADREIHNDACRAELRNQAPSTNPLPVDIHSTSE
jgi:hypothetical protein